MSPAGGRGGGPPGHALAAGGSRTPSVAGSCERRAYRAGHVTAAAPRRGRGHAAMDTAFGVAMATGGPRSCGSVRRGRGASPRQRDRAACVTRAARAGDKSDVTATGLGRRRGSPWRRRRCPPCWPGPAASGWRRGRSHLSGRVGPVAFPLCFRRACTQGSIGLHEMKRFLLIKTLLFSQFPSERSEWEGRERWSRAACPLRGRETWFVFVHFFVRK